MYFHVFCSDWDFKIIMGTRRMRKKKTLIIFLTWQQISDQETCLLIILSFLLFSTTFFEFLLLHVLSLQHFFSRRVILTPTLTSYLGILSPRFWPTHDRSRAPMQCACLFWTLVLSANLIN
jgi:hypothetical protein